MCMCVRVHNYGYGIDLCSFMCKLVKVINLLTLSAHAREGYSSHFVMYVGH